MAAAGGVLALLLTGCAQRLAFGTATKFGIDISQRADQRVDVSLGYDRVEVASIPVPEADGKRIATGDQDAYSILGTFYVDVDPNLTSTGTGLHLNQLFATGFAARNAAANPNIGGALGRQAGKIHAEKQGMEDSTSEKKVEREAGKQEVKKAKATGGTQ